MSTFEAQPTAEALRDLCQLSPYPSDGGELIGRDPKEVPSEILALWNKEHNPLKALRARCLDCCCGSAPEVRKCTAVNCPSWPFRMGTSPWKAPRQLSDEQREALRQRGRSLGRKTGGAPSPIDSLPSLDAGSVSDAP